MWLSIPAIPKKGGLEGTSVMAGEEWDACLVLFFDLALLHVPAEGGGRLLVAGHEQNASRAPVQSMHHLHPQHPNSASMKPPSMESHTHETGTLLKCLLLLQVQLRLHSP